MNSEEAVQLLQQVIQIPTVARDEAKVADILEQLVAPYVQAGKMTCERLNYAPGRDNLIIKLGSDDAPVKLGIDGHMDVVDAGDAAKWQHAPFAAEIADGKLYGRGASDMKSGLIASFIAFLEVAQTLDPAQKQLVFFATVGEEVDNYGARQLAAGHYADGLDGLLVCEPSGPQIQPSCRGIIDYTVTAKGKAAHSSTPEEGANAISGLFAYSAAVAEEVAPLIAKKHAMLGHATHSITLIKGGNQVNIIPEAASLRANIRTTPLATNAEFTAAIKRALAKANAAVDGVTLDLSVDSTIDFAASPADNKLVQSIQTARGAIDLPEVPVVGGTGINDAAVMLQPGMDLAEYGPGSDTSHQTDEYVEIADFLAAIQVYKELFANY
ncbi:ArgE/DapE family deacylase [Lacticaseibacillus songhuajiangensis]|jgi:succinyl-diaminopimelate desuccinylase|uniref:ArgE/DapE family deacylase n=1 Tax=Lacticaseibacillus songhuajiangensis TaxID=1296539 RepID=UPI000F771151|nr:ArgE/DapE family deacylase [Lacticaseibacillus songhuajiangensis]